MSREISQDIELLLNYLKNFKLVECFENDNYSIFLKSMHKKAYGLLLFIAEAQIQKTALINTLSFKYYKETCSDIIQSLFCWSTGSYKAANMMLRSSIETFLKAVLGSDNEAVYDEKSIYKLFEKAQANAFFSGDIREQKYKIIHDAYKELCRIAHSAKDINLGTISSINLLPRFDEELASEYKRMFLTLLDAILSSILINYQSIINHMHSFNKVVFSNTITPSSKKEIYDKY